MEAGHDEPHIWHAEDYSDDELRARGVSEDGIRRLRNATTFIGDPAAELKKPEDLLADEQRARRRLVNQTIKAVDFDNPAYHVVLHTTDGVVGLVRR